MFTGHASTLCEAGGFKKNPTAQHTVGVISPEGGFTGGTPSPFVLKLVPDQGLVKWLVAVEISSSILPTIPA